MSSKWYLLFYIGLLVACIRKSNIESDTKYVFGPDNRIEYKVSESPFNFIGIVKTQSGSNCTGSLVGHRLVLTNKHCVALNKNKLSASNPTYFITNTSNNYKTLPSSNKLRIVDFMAGTYLPGDDPTSDWAVLALESHPNDSNGNPLGYFEISSDKLKNGYRVILAGYSFRPTGEAMLNLHVYCSIRHVYDDGCLYHDCDITLGFSGSSLLTNCPDSNSQTGVCIIGLHAQENRQTGGKFLKEYSHKKANIASSYKVWSHAIIKMRARYGSGRK